MGRAILVSSIRADGELHGGADLVRNFVNSRVTFMFWGAKLDIVFINLGLSGWVLLIGMECRNLTLRPFLAFDITYTRTPG